MSGTPQNKANSAAIKEAMALHLPTNDESRLAVMSRRADMIVDEGNSNKIFTAMNAEWAATLIPELALAKQGAAFGLPHQISAADVDVVNVSLRERFATGHIDELVRQAVDQVLKAEH